MMMTRFSQGCIVVFCMAMLCFPARAGTPLIADLSNYEINIDSGFNGTRIFLFGARVGNGDVVAVVRGPDKRYMVRKKEQVAGLWLNRERMKFYGLPDFYAVAASRPLEEIDENGLFRQLGIGQKQLFSTPSPEDQPRFDEFSQAFLRYQQGRNLYTAQPAGLSFMGETLFKTVFEFPDGIPPGDYTAEVYLINDGEIAGMQSTPITVIKSGLDAFLYRQAHAHPAWYGLAAVALALLSGWIAGRVFERR